MNAPPAPPALRALFLANDGASVGHVTRAIAVARALRREAERCGIPVQTVLATTSTADALLAWSGLPVVRIPPPGAIGLTETDRRALATKVLEGVVAGLCPDVLVTDTFPSGPQLEAWSILDTVPRRVLVRRTVRPERSGEAVVLAGLDRYDRIIVPDDPMPELTAGLSPDSRTVRVSPIVLLRDDEMLNRDAARAELRVRHGIEINGDGDVLVGVRAEDARDGRSPLDVLRRALAGSGRRIVAADGRVVPLQRCVRAFDLAVVAAGFNTAHETAAAGVPAVLFARPREFDDQAARARRFEAEGLAVHLASWDEDEVRAAIDRATSDDGPRALRCTGAAETACEILALCGVRVPAAVRA